jgi:hypothetical protein
VVPEVRQGPLRHHFRRSCAVNRQLPGALIWWWSTSSELTSCSSLGPGCHKHAATRTTTLTQLAVVGGCGLASALVCIQEAADLHVQGFRLAEEVSLPGMAAWLCASPRRRCACLRCCTISPSAESFVDDMIYA